MKKKNRTLKRITANPPKIPKSEIISFQEYNDFITNKAFEIYNKKHKERGCVQGVDTKSKTSRVLKVQ